MFKTSAKILIVDDMATQRSRISNQVRNMGFTNLSQSDNGKNALTAIQKEADDGQPFELIISDWNMPEMTGMNLLKTLRVDERFKNLPFLMVTAEGEREQVVEAIKAGVSDYVIKPVDQENLKLKMFNVWKKHNS